MYGLLVLNSSSGLNIHLQCSNRESARQAAEEVEQHKTREQPSFRSAPQKPETQRKPEPPKTRTGSAKADWEILEVSMSATAEQIDKAYLHLAKIYHPDKVESLAPVYKEIAITRMKEINAAYGRLKLRFCG